MPPPLQLAHSSGARKSNLAFALLCLPRERRADAIVFYDFCRAVDDIADDPLHPSDQKTDLLARWKRALDHPADLPPAFADLVSRRNLDPKLLREIILGVEMDIEPLRFATFEDLRSYCWRVACAVGLVSIEIFGCRQPASKIYAEKLGYALQLTNIIRDVGEDASLGRIYLPLEDLRRFGVSEASVLAGQPDGDFSALMLFQAERAWEMFREAKSALAQEDARALRPARAMQETYEKLLARMAADGFRVFEKRYRLSLMEKVFILGKSLCR